jgi:hypothetical protein
VKGWALGNIGKRQLGVHGFHGYRLGGVDRAAASYGYDAVTGKFMAISVPSWTFVEVGSLATPL